MATSMSRTELQALAKQHGIKANMKNTEIEAALKEKGVTFAKKAGLAVRDSNIVSEKATTASKKSIAKPVVESKEVDVENQATNVEPSNKTVDAKSASSELPPLPKRTSRSSKASSEPQVESSQSDDTASTGSSQRRRSSRLSGDMGAPIIPETPAGTKTRSQPSPTTSLKATPGGNSVAMEESETNDEEEEENSKENQLVAALDSRRTSKYTSKRRTSERDQVQRQVQEEMNPMQPLDAKADDTAQPMVPNAAVMPQVAQAPHPATPAPQPVVEEAPPKSKRSGRQIKVQLVEDEPKESELSAASAAKIETTETAHQPLQETQIQEVQAVVPAPMEAPELPNKTEAEVPPVMAPPASVPLRKLAPMPLILPPTPDKIREEINASIATQKSQIEVLQKQYENAISALSFVPDLLRKQRELLQKLDETRDENKRLREYFDSNC